MNRFPRVTAIGFLVNPTNPNAEQDMIAGAAASRAFGHEPVIGKAGTEKEIESAIEALVKQRAGAVVVFPMRSSPAASINLWY